LAAVGGGDNTMAAVVTAVMSIASYSMAATSPYIQTENDKEEVDEIIVQAASKGKLRQNGVWSMSESEVQNKESSYSQERSLSACEDQGTVKENHVASYTEASHEEAEPLDMSSTAPQTHVSSTVAKIQVVATVVSTVNQDGAFCTATSEGDEDQGYDDEEPPLSPLELDEPVLAQHTQSARYTASESWWSCGMDSPRSSLDLPMRPRRSVPRLSHQDPRQSIGEGRDPTHGAEQEGISQGGWSKASQPFKPKLEVHIAEEIRSPKEIHGGLDDEGDVVSVKLNEELDERLSLPGSPVWSPKMNPSKQPDGKFAQTMRDKWVHNLYGLVNRVNKDGTSMIEWKVGSKRDMHERRLAAAAEKREASCGWACPSSPSV